MSRQLNYYYRNAERINANTAHRRSKPSGRASVLLSSCRRRAEKKGIEFDLTKSWIQTRLEGQCELSGLNFDFQAGARDPYSPSIDRIDASGGYTQDNCRVILWSLNAAFGTWGADAFRDIAFAWLGVTEQKPENQARTA